MSDCFVSICLAAESEVVFRQKKTQKQSNDDKGTG